MHVWTYNLLPIYLLNLGCYLFSIFCCAYVYLCLYLGFRFHISLFCQTIGICPTSLFFNCQYCCIYLLKLIQVGTFLGTILFLCKSKYANLFFDFAWVNWSDLWCPPVAFIILISDRCMIQMQRNCREQLVNLSCCLDQGVINDEQDNEIVKWGKSIVIH